MVIKAAASELGQLNPEATLLTIYRLWSQVNTDSIPPIRL